MFNNQNSKTELMIVCEKNLMVYANYLIGLIGQNDDVEGEIVGTKDNRVTAAIYTPKNYNDTLPKITSNTHILFIGTFKEAKEQIANVDIKFDKYGMHYGWLGKRAVMYVDDKILNKEDYEKFLKENRKYQQNFENVNLTSIDKHRKIKKVASFFVPLGSLYMTSNDIKHEIKEHEIKDQQYRCLTMALYLDGLNEFMEG